MLNENILKEINFSKSENNTLPVIVQDLHSSEILMLAYMNEESLLQTIKTRKATYWSRSRKKIWVKGESSGNFQEVKEILLDCDGDTILLKVIPCTTNENIPFASCHLGYKSCFFRTLKNEKWEINSKILFDPKKVYKST
jgi:phosphoribosyl-AMP cyclohydrolase